MNRWKPVLVVVGLLALLASSVRAEPPGAPSLAEDARLSHLRRRVDWAIALTERRFLDPERHTPWQIAHGMIAFGQKFRLRRASGEFVGAVDYFCSEAIANGRRIFQPTADGLESLSGSGLEGHPDQFLAIFAQAGVPVARTIDVDGRQYAVSDLVRQAQRDYYAGQEAPWTLISLATYLPIDAVWENRAGRRFSIEDLVQAEVSADPTSGACGGTHNLYALTYAIGRKQAAGGLLAGVWKQAAQKVVRYQQMARSLQNADGSLSSNFFEGPGSPADDVEQLYTTGHTLEWLALSLSDEELNAPWVTDSVESLVGVFERTRREPLDCGPLYHAAHALALYRDRKRWTPEETVAQVPAAPGAKDDDSADPSAP